MSADAAPDNPFVAFWRATGFFETKIPKTIRIGDMRYGVILRTLQWGIVAAIVYEMMYTFSYERRFSASGIVLESWLDRSGIADEMKRAPTKPYCAQPYEFDYEYCNKSSADGRFNEFWCEKPITCEFVDPALAMYMQTPTDVWVYTYAKRRVNRGVACSAGAGACANGELFEELGARCQCVKTTNSFIAGAEGGTYAFKHKPVLDFSTDFTFKVPTTDMYAEVLEPTTGEVVARNVLVKSFAEGALVTFTISELMQATGISSLDATDPVVAADNPTAVGNPSYRITGIAFEIRVVYEGSISRFASNRPPHAKVHVKAVPGWHSIGDDAFQDDEHYLGSGSGATGREESPTGDSYSIYRRGVHMHITFGGEIGFIDVMALFTQVRRPRGDRTPWVTPPHPHGSPHPTPWVTPIPPHHPPPSRRSRPWGCTWPSPRSSSTACCSRSSATPRASTASRSARSSPSRTCTRKRARRR